MSRTARPGRAGVALMGALVLLVLLVPAADAQVPVPLPLGPFIGPSDIELQVLTEETQDPTAIDVADDGRVVFTERKGAVKVILPSGELVTAGRIPTAANECTDCPDDLNEGGVHGLLLSPDFATDDTVYIYYSVPGSQGVAPNPPKHPDAGGTQALEGINRLSTFTLTDDNVLDLASEEVIYENAVEWLECCHYGGDLDLLPDGTLVLSNADDTNPFESSGYAPIDERRNPGDVFDRDTHREAFDAQRTSANLADRRGKVLRINLDGTIPDGSVPGVAANPFVDDPGADPAVYALGFRSNYRIATHAQTGTVYVGNVGPDAGAANASRGPAGHDELDVIPPGGGTNHGWPYCIADNQPYMDYDFATGTSGEAFDCTGYTEPALWYDARFSLLWPQLRTGGRTSMTGLVYDYEGDGPLALPDRLQQKLLWFEWSRNLIFSIPVGGDGSLDTTMTSVQTESAISSRHPHDAEIGPDGAVYLVEYGTSFWNNSNSRISRIACAGCTPDAGSAPTVHVVGPTAADVPAADGSRSGSPLLGSAVVILLAGVGLRRRRRAVA
jgi:glucose/arabinose dehydrogenase